MKKIFTLIAAALFAVVANAAVLDFDFSVFGDGVDCKGSEPVMQDGFSFLGNNSKVTLTSAGFYTGGSSSSSARYISYTPMFDGTLTVTASPAGSSERYVGITTAPMSPTPGLDGVVAITLMDTKGVQVTASANLTAGRTYYICLNGNGSVTGISYESDTRLFELAVVISQAQKLDTQLGGNETLEAAIAAAIDVVDKPTATDEEAVAAIAALKDVMDKLLAGIKDITVASGKTVKYVENGKVVIVNGSNKYNAGGVMQK